MKKPNTKRHWTALALARYYERTGEAARARDLYPLVTEIHETPDRLVSTLQPLDTGDYIDHIVVTSPTRRGGSSDTFAYYPTTITIETLRDIGLPTELPDGSPIPEDWDIELPTARVNDPDEVKPPTRDSEPLEYQRMGGSRNTSGRKRQYDTSRRNEEAKYILTENGGDSSPLDDEDEGFTTEDTGNRFACHYCGKTFETAESRKAHLANCPENPNVDSDIVCDVCGEEFKTAGGLGSHMRTHDSSDTDEADEDESEMPYACKYCGEGFDNPRSLGGHVRHCDEKPPEPEEEDTSDEETYTCEFCGKTFDNPHGYGGHLNAHRGEEPPETPLSDIDWDALTPAITRIEREPTPDSAPDIPVEVEDFDDGMDTDDDRIPANPGSLARVLNWNRVARDLELIAEEAYENGMTEVASAYSQMAVLAQEGDLPRRQAFILLGTPVLDIEDGAVEEAEIAVRKHL